MFHTSPNRESLIFNAAAFFEAPCFLSEINMLRLRLRSLGLHLLKNLSHPGVALVPGFYCKNCASSYCIMQISRKDISLELRLFRKVLLIYMTNHFGTRFRSHPSYRFLLDAGFRLLEASWKEFITGVNVFPTGSTRRS